MNSRKSLGLMVHMPSARCKAMFDRLIFRIPNMVVHSNLFALPTRPGDIDVHRPAVSCDVIPRRDFNGPAHVLVAECNSAIFADVLSGHDGLLIVTSNHNSNSNLDLRQRSVGAARPAGIRVLARQPHA
ncbi:hypothetical protein X947_5367 [Burkholderia pseudomallei MSHR7334]|nr:hypothetical protein X947_5367 [Burkholderia pseudomallei MSHR7334]